MFDKHSECPRIPNVSERSGFIAVRSNEVLAAAALPQLGNDDPDL